MLALESWKEFQCDGGRSIGGGVIGGSTKLLCCRGQAFLGLLLGPLDGRSGAVDNPVETFSAVHRYREVSRHCVAAR